MTGILHEDVRETVGARVTVEGTSRLLCEQNFLFLRQNIKF
jgi:hypothetical protein